MTYRCNKIHYKKCKMKGFFACDVLKFCIIIKSKFLEAETRLKLIYIIYLKACLLSWIRLRLG